MSSFFGGNNNNNNNASTGFGGFGSSTNTGTGFGANNTTSGGSLFGGNTATAGAGSGFGGFGSQNQNSSSLFGGQKAGGFGTTTATSGGGIFGNNTSTAGGGGFGGFGNTNTASTSGFGGSGGLFGQNKPATTGFGSANTGSIFGGGNNATTGGFGGTNSTFGTGGTGGTFTTAPSTFGSTNNTTSAFGFGAGSTTGSNNSGTGNTPFQAFTEKDQAAGQMSHYQTITFQDPYKSKSLEELRVEDYLQGRQYGNSNGQAGGFGATQFGGSSNVFGGNNTANASTGGGLFGSTNNTNTSGGFGTNNASTASGFGNTTGGGLFGSQNKPAGGGLFGASQTTAQTTGGFGSTAGSGGGLFGGGGFGANNNNNTSNTTGGGLFGSNNQAKPATSFGGFGANNTTNTAGFGSNNQQSGGLFGGNTNNNQTTGGLFGSNANQPQQSGGLFGNNNNNNNTNQTGGGLFGQNKPATGGGLFGSSTTPATGGNLFGGNTAQQNTSGGLFGSTNTNTNTAGGLFGNQNKPAGTGTGLFGSTANNQPAGGSLFGNNNQQQAGSLFGGNNNNQGSSLFGNQNKPATGSLFGSTNNTGTGGGLFGGSMQNQQQNSGSLFGGSMSTNQTQQNSGSLFGGNNSFAQSNNQTPQQSQLHATLTQNAYGNDQLFASLGAASSQVGPLATPLTGAKPVQTKTPSLLSSTRLNSPAYTPRASIGRHGGFGFSYSNYGTPGSAYSVSLTPGASSLLKPTGSLGSALTSRLAKSVSMNNLRGDSTPREGESLLRPTPGSASTRYLQTGSMRKLNIDRSLRSDLFSPLPENKPVESAREGNAPPLRKKVSFDNNVQTNGTASTAEPSASNALVPREDPDEQPSAPFRAAPASRSQVNTPEMQQVNGSSLSTVPENSEPHRPAAAASNKPAAEEHNPDDPEPGDYWMKPSLKDLKNMSRAQLSKVGNFVVGRKNVGRVEFGPCDLTNTELDDIFGKIVQLYIRHATVYPDEVSKPVPGKGLNVPSSIYLEHIWPRSTKNKKNKAFSQPQIERQVARLRKVENTEFVSWDVKTGIWCFTVEHYTTYGLDDDEDEDYTEDMQHDTSALSEPATPGLPEDDTMRSIETGTGSGELDDTFQFKMDQRSRSSGPVASVPGGFDSAQITFDYDDPSADEGMEDEFVASRHLDDADMDDPFVSSGAVQALSPGAIERYHSSMLVDEVDDEMGITEDQQAESEPEMPGAFAPEEPKLLRSILKPTGMSRILSPEHLVTESWEEQLQQTMSPVKRDRQALKVAQQTFLKSPEDNMIESPFKLSMLGQSALGQSYLAQKSAKRVGFGRSVMGAEQTSDLGKSQAFKTSMDIMNSLWTQNKPAKKHAATKGFEV